MKSFVSSLNLALLMGLLPLAQSGGAAEAATGNTGQPAVELAGDAATAPDLETILRGVAGRWRLEQQNTDQFRQRYAYTHRTITEKWAEEGVLKERTEESLRWDPRQSKGEQRKKARREQRGPGYHTDDFEDLEAVLRRFDFRVAGREVVRGRVCWVIEFRPKDPPVPARNLKERLINAVAGRTWVDAQEHVAVRLDLRLEREVGVIGGIVGNVRACHAQFERQRTADGLWYTPQFSWHLEGRAMFSRKHVTHREEKTDLERIE